YYPGCSLRHSSAEFDRATRKVLEVLGVEFQEVPDWTCCGSTPAHMMDHLLAQSLAARNLRQAAEVGGELLAPCPSCYQREKNAEIEIHKNDAFRSEVNELLDKPYQGHVIVYALPEYLMKFVGEEKIASAVKVDLSQLRVVPYYGCLLGRPSEMTGECDNEQPMWMDLILQAAGADVKWWNYKTECCGASVGMPKMEIQRRLSGKVLCQALAAGADAVVVGCPLCHVNLDLKQAQINKFNGTDYHVPILYLSQVLGLAFGLSADDVMLNKNVVDPEPLVKKAVVEAAVVRAEEERKAAEKAAKAAAREAKAATAAAGAAPAGAPEQAAEAEAKP
ncbi:MAG: CoB--CoM heterodisulfide reductase iron-sulfur subunit B family protein, partial [Actinobacteria bacterium]|nr:CoB--CoM heterodisulfide reductase iron-sulfur subunit B family protein [Actinomycetota bacterium]